MSASIFACGLVADENDQQFGALSSEALQSEDTSYQMTWGEVTDKLLDIMQLEDDWDGMGASVPDHSLVETCFEIVRQLRNRDNLSAPTIVRPSPDGNICIEWQAGPICLEMEVSQESIDWILSGPAMETKIWSTPRIDGGH